VWLKLLNRSLQIKAYGHEDPRKVIAGIVPAGGGAQLKHIKQLVEYITGMDTNWIPKRAFG
jgi:Tfp pilus assembly PilM family ATPase